MFVLPPPPRHPNGQLYGAGAPGVALLETNNTLQHPTGPEHQLLLGEGSYTLKDDLHLATPPPHPSEAPQINNNPLATTIGPPIAGVKLSISILAPRKPPTQNLFRTSTALSARSIPPSIQEEAHGAKGDGGLAANGFGSASYYNQPPNFGAGNPTLAALPAKTRKEQKLKPKNNIVKSSSAFVSRVIPHDALSKRLNDRPADALFAFANINRAFLWLDLSSESKLENLTKILFTKANPLCHDVNELTKSSSHLDVVIGFNSGDIIWYEPFSQRYARLNKNGVINATPMSAVLWLPNKENLFVAAHMDGTLVVYDKEKEDAEFEPEDFYSTAGSYGGGQGETAKARFQMKKSVQSRNQKTNPVAVWKISTMKLNSIAFSPDGQLLAAVSEDGTLAIVDYIHERVLDVFRSYYGALLCVTWSPDGRYVLTGGQDDLVSVWSVAERALVARGVGHHSWVTAVAFDPWRCDERTYRFGSVGDDCRLLLWDFSVGMLGRPKAVSMRPRGSVSSYVPPPSSGGGGGGGIGGGGGGNSAGGTGSDRRQSMATVGRLRSNSSLTQADAPEDAAGDVLHPVESKASTATLPPVMSKIIDEHPLCWLGFEEHCILTSCKDGHIREWSRPTDGS